jgi:hypothetical protein
MQADNKEGLRGINVLTERIDIDKTSSHQDNVFINNWKIEVIGKSPLNKYLPDKD